MNSSTAQIKDLKDFQWENRLLIIYTNSDNQSQIKNQLTDIEKAKTDFAQRDLKVIILRNQKVEIWNSSAAHQLEFDLIIKDLKISTQKSYENLLIGKDGGVKLRKNSPISNQKLFNTIDAMPMRQREMRDGN
jgi:hypothetical protein